MMNNIFIKNSTTVTVKYDNYEWRGTDSGELFLVPSADSDLVIFDPLEDVERLVLDTAAASVRCFRRAITAASEITLSIITEKQG